MKLYYWTILVLGFLLFVDGRPAIDEGFQPDFDNSAKSDEDDVIDASTTDPENESSHQSWVYDRFPMSDFRPSVDLQISDNSSEQSESDDDTDPVSLADIIRERFNESKLLVDRSQASFVPRTCRDSYMTVAVPRNLGRTDGDDGSGDSVKILKSACNIPMRLNETHMIFNLSYDSFSQANCPKLNWSKPCCDELRAITYDVGIAYVFEMTLYTYGINAEPEIDDLVAYCYFETKKHVEKDVTHTSIRIYSSQYDHIAFTGTTKQMGPKELAFLEVASQEGPSDMENIPINCWLSPHPTKNESLMDMTRSLFLKDGCPKHADAYVALPERVRNTFSYIGGPRVAFSLASGGRIGNQKDDKYLYAHCEYVKCSNASQLDGSGKLPPCPWVFRCAYDLPLPYTKDQYAVATSDVVLVSAPKAPQEIHVPAVPDLVKLSDSGNRNNQHSGADLVEPSDSGNRDNQHSSTDPVSKECERSPFSNILVVVIVILGFVLGFALGCGICCWERGLKAKLCRRNRRRHQDDVEAGFSGTTSLKRDKELDVWSSSTQEPPATHRQPDVLAQTPNSKRAHSVRQAPNRHRHMAGRDGYEPERPSFSQPDFSNRVGESTIVRADESWNNKDIQVRDIGIRDSID